MTKSTSSDALNIIILAHESLVVVETWFGSEHIPHLNSTDNHTSSFTQYIYIDRFQQKKTKLLVTTINPTDSHVDQYNQSSWWRFNEHKPSRLDTASVMQITRFISRTHIKCDSCKSMLRDNSHRCLSPWSKFRPLFFSEAITCSRFNYGIGEGCLLGTVLSNVGKIATSWVGLKLKVCRMKISEWLLKDTLLFVFGMVGPGQRVGIADHHGFFWDSFWVAQTVLKEAPSSCQDMLPARYSLTLCI